ncbi:MAG TPA: O-methyltransferase [Phycisphaerae bacterium]|nr:O-methyltransferase [Phycisphaerae bacterium]
MSEASTPVNAEHFAYIAAHTSREDDFLKELKRQAAVAGLPPIWIAPEQAGFLQILLRLARACEVVEVGTLAGYSAISMARALPPGGRVRTIEISAAYADFAEHWVRRSDVADRIEIYRGDAKQVLPKFDSDSADAAFIDADKESYPFYLRECLRIVRRGGLILADNALAHGNILDARSADPMVPMVRRFNEQMAKLKRLQSIIVPLGDGCWVGVKD